MSTRSVSHRPEKTPTSRRNSSRRRDEEPHGTVSGWGRWLKRYPLLWLLAAALMVKAIVLAQLGGHPLLQAHGDLDTTHYIDLARTVAEGGPLAVTQPFFVSPLYVYFLAAVFSVGGSLFAAKLVQILLGTVAAGLLYVTARQWFGPRAAGIAAALFVLTGLFTFYEILILQAALDPFLVAFSLYFTSRAQLDSRRWPAVVAGMAVGFLALNRPNALAYGVVAAVLIVVESWRRPVSPAAALPAGTSLARAALFVAGLLLVLTPNAVRNYAVSGELILVSSHGGLNFYIGNNADADGTYTRLPSIAPSIIGQAADATRVAEEAAGRRLSAGEVSEYFYGRAWEWIAAHPPAALRLFARKLALVLNKTNVPLNYSYTYYSRDESTLLRGLVVGPWLVVPLGLVGLFLPSMRTERPGFWVWAAFVPVYGFSVAAFFVSSRYRMPLLVPLCASSGATVVWVIERLRSRNFAALAAGTTAIVVLAVLANWDLGLDDGRGGEQTRKAVWLVEQGAYEEARAYVARVSARHSHPGVLRFQVGKALATAGRFEEAVERFREALEIDRDQPAIHLELGQALAVSNRAEEALPHLNSALDAGFRPEVSGPWLVRALASSGGKAQAVTLLADLPDDVAASAKETAFDLGTLALALEAPAQAERWLRMAVARTPARGAAHENLGVALVLLGRADEAVPALEAACRLDPSSASAHLNLAVAYAQAGRLSDARVEAQRAASLDPAEPRAAELLKRLSPPRQR